MRRLTQSDRRQFIVGCLACCSVHAASGQVFEADELSGGCFLNAPRREDALSAVAKGLNREDWLESTGDRDFDRALGRAIIRLSEFFGEKPAFGIVEGEEHNNAFALRKAGPGAKFGTVGFGRTMLEDLRARDPSGMSILAIIAHEFGHIAQYRRQVMEELNAGSHSVRRSELHADFLTGCYLGRTKRREPRVSVRLAGQFMESIGDNLTESEHHHGTHQERLASVEAGFNLALETPLAFEAYFNQGKAYILATF